MRKDKSKRMKFIKFIKDHETFIKNKQFNYWIYTLYKLQNNNMKIYRKIENYNIPTLFLGKLTFFY